MEAPTLPWLNLNIPFLQFPENTDSAIRTSKEFAKTVVYYAAKAKAAKLVVVAVRRNGVFLGVLKYFVPVRAVAFGFNSITPLVNQAPYVDEEPEGLEELLNEAEEVCRGEYGVRIEVDGNAGVAVYRCVDGREGRREIRMPW